MDSVLLVLRLMLTAVFLVAGFTKLADLAGSRAALRDFGVPAALASPFGVLLPLAELAVAVALLPSVTAWWGAMGALVLLLLFVAGIGYNLARGRTPDCHCFGQLHSAPAGPSTLIRNLVLAALAGVVVVFGRTTAGLDLGSWLGTLSVAQRIEFIGGVVVLAVLVGILWLLWHILRQQGRLLLRIEAAESRLVEAGLAPMTVQEAGEEGRGLAVGTQAPGFRLPDLYGELITLEALRSEGLAVVLLFSDPNCGPCAAIFREVSRWQRVYANKLTIAVVSRGTLQANRSKAGEHGITHVLLQQDREVAAAYQASATPSAVLIDRDGTIGSPLAQGVDAIRGLVASAVGLPVLRTVPMAAAASQRNGHGATAAPRPPTGLKIGDAAPDFSLSDLSGNLVHLSDFRGHQTLVLFWRPSCGFCQRMLADLKAWEAQPPEGAPRLLVVSTESVQDNQAMGLRSPVVLDQAGMSIGSKFGASGTPMAILVDAEGGIASELAAGALAILALATTQPTEAEGSIELTIGMATYNDFDGVYFTLQALRLYQDLEQTELLVIDNYGCQHTQNLVEGWLGARYIRATDAVGTAAPRDLVFREARGKAVLCCDSHVLFAPGVIARLKQFYREHPECQDLLQGPLLYDDGKLLASHFDPVWRGQMWGTWGTDPRGLDPEGEPFEIPMQGLGVFSCLKGAWLGFHPEFPGFGGEEGYIHEKFRQAGRRCLCLPWLRWMHRFSRPSGVMYPLLVEDKLRNYVIGHAELGLDLAPVLRHFSECLPEDRVVALAEQALGGRWTGSAFICEKDPVHRERDGPGSLQETPAKAASDWMNQGVMHRREPVQPSLSYLICATPRTGSYLLSDALSSTGIVGRPEEFFRPAILAQFPKDAGAAIYTAYFQHVLAQGMTSNAVFGAKMHWSHLENLRTLPDYQDRPLSELLPGIFPNLRYIHISRQDRLRQAVSFLKAMQTNVWWSMDDNASRASAPDFHMAALDALIQQIEDDEAAWKDYFKHVGVQPIEVVYEDLAHSRAQYEQIIRQVLHGLEIPVPLALALPEPRYKKQADETSEAWVERYLQLKHSSPLRV